MKIQETIVPLDDNDRKVFYQVFIQYQIIAYGLAIGGGIWAVIEEEILPFVIGVILAILTFIYTYFDFQSILADNSKVIIKGKIEKKRSGGGDSPDYYFFLENYPKPIKFKVTEEIYQQFSVTDFVTLHKGIHKNTCHRADKLTI